jgi:putative exosortase-associated protein (TIGR04073 family)
MNSEKVLKTFIRITLIAAVLPIVLDSGGVSFAGPAEKFGRGATNFLTGWAEIFTSADKAADHNGSYVGAISGLPTGFARAVTRTSLGFYEAATAPFPFPENSPMTLEPEFVMGNKFKDLKNGKVAYHYE